MPVERYDGSAGSWVGAIYDSSRGERFLGKPSHNYDFAYSEDWADAHGYYPDARGHRDDRVKKPAHPTHPSRGRFMSLYEFALTDRGMDDPNYTLFGLVDGAQDPQAVMTYRGSRVLPEVTVTPDYTYIHNPYDNTDIYAGGGDIGGAGQSRRTGHGRTWSDKVRLTDRGLEGQSGVSYYFDGDGNAVNAATGRKGHIALDEVVVTPFSGTITEDEQNNALEQQGYLYRQKGSRINGVNDKDVQRIPNASPTFAESADLENQMYSHIDRYRMQNNYRTSAFDIPYGDRLVKVQVGTAAPKFISANALDTVAKYAGRTGTPIPVMLGLPEQETGWGKRPYYNFSNDISKRALGNADYFKAFGYIPQEYLVRDFRYNDDLNGGREPAPVTTPPLQHAFEYFNSGNYNRGDASHTSDVVNAGNALWNESTGNLLKWWNTEGKYWYDKGKKP